MGDPIPFDLCHTCLGFSRPYFSFILRYSTLLLVFYKNIKAALYPSLIRERRRAEYLFLFDTLFFDSIYIESGISFVLLLPVDKYLFYNSIIDSIFKLYYSSQISEVPTTYIIKIIS